MKRVVLCAALAILAPAASMAAPMQFEEAVIEGEIQKPEVTVYIARQNLNKAYDLELKESFLPRIIKALEDPPF